MKHIDFTQDFYKELYKALYDYCKSYCDENYVDFSEGISAEVEVAKDDNSAYTIYADCSCMTEWHDESFNHLFGVWHDPNPYYKFTDVEGISDVHIYDDDGEEVEGFDKEAYYEQFREYEHGGFKKGDKVRVLKYGKLSEIVYEILYYDTQYSKFNIKRVGDKLRTSYEHRAYLRKVA